MTLHTLPSPPASTNSLPFHLSPNGVASKALVLVVLRMIMLMMVMMEDDDVDDGDEDDDVSYESENLSKPVNNLRAVSLRVRVPAGLRRNSWAIHLHRVPLAIFLRPLH